MKKERLQIKSMKYETILRSLSTRYILSKGRDLKIIEDIIVNLQIAEEELGENWVLSLLEKDIYLGKIVDKKGGYK